MELFSLFFLIRMCFFALFSILLQHFGVGGEAAQARRTKGEAGGPSEGHEAAPKSPRTMDPAEEVFIQTFTYSGLYNNRGRRCLSLFEKLGVRMIIFHL